MKAITRHRAWTCCLIGMAWGAAMSVLALDGGQKVSADAAGRAKVNPESRRLVTGANGHLRTLARGGGAGGGMYLSLEELAPSCGTTGSNTIVNDGVGMVTFGIFLGGWRGIPLKTWQATIDGVEPDNVDGYTNDPGFPLTATDQLAFNRFLANEAHQRGLAVGLKNDLDQIPDLVEYFDFSVNEQCHEFDECDALSPFVAAGKAVFNAEYDNAFVTNDILRAEMCAGSLAQDLRTLVLSIELDDSIRLSCDE